MSLPRLHRPEDVAEALGASAWWVKDQARKKRFPAERVAGSFRFTDAQYAEILRRLEEPAEPDAAPAAPRQRTRSTTTDDAELVQLRPRPPRRTRLVS